MNPQLERAELRRERIAELTRQGCSAPLIAEILGITTRTVQRARKRAGISQPRPPFTSPEERARMGELIREGVSYKEVARTLGRNEMTIARHYPGFAWTPQQVAEAGVLSRRMARIYPEPGRYARIL